ncbi:hypothetical protein D3C84_400880 [compost metagenome]
MSRRQFALALSDKYLLVGSALLLALIGLVLSRDAEMTAPRAVLTATAMPTSLPTETVPVRRLQQISSDNLAPVWTAPPRQSGWVF